MPETAAFVQQSSGSSRSQVMRMGSGSRPSGRGDHPLATLDITAVPVALGAEEELFDQDSPLRHCYRVVSGCLRTVRLMEDGRRLIDRFLLPGDLLGFEAGTHYDVSAQAVCPTVLRRYTHQSVCALARRDAEFAHFLWCTAAAQLHDAQAHALLLGRKTAVERVASFLNDMAARAPRDAAGCITLQMGRADIADHLGLTVETVSRTLTQLRREGVITVQPGAVGIRNGGMLASLASMVAPSAAVAGANPVVRVGGVRH